MYLSVPYSHVCLDIETANADPAEAERWARTYWSPSSKWTALTIGERYLEALAKKKDRLALLDQSPIIAIAIQTERDIRCLHWMRQHAPVNQYGGVVEGFSSERDMLAGLRWLLNSTLCTPESILIGHNIKHFDLRKLRHAFIRHRLQVPAVLVNPEQPVFDLMLEYHRLFALGNDPLMISFADLMDQFGLPHHKGELDGSEIPDLYASGQFERIIEYSLKDARAEYQAFLRMTGQAPDEAAVNGQAQPAVAAPIAMQATPPAAAAPQSEAVKESTKPESPPAKLRRKAPAADF